MVSQAALGLALGVDASVGVRAREAPTYDPYLGRPRHSRSGSGGTEDIPPAFLLLTYPFFVLGRHVHTYLGPSRLNHPHHH